MNVRPRAILPYILSNSDIGNGSDVFGSDICIANPTSLTPLKSAYAVHRMAVLALSCISERKGGHWAKLPTMLVFHRVSVSLLANPSLFLARYLVYNLRKRGGNSADKYFKLTEMIAGVKDTRFQALMPHVLHWLGIKKVEKVVSMSDMKYDAIVKSGIEIRKRYDILGQYFRWLCPCVSSSMPFVILRVYLTDLFIPPDSRVEIGAKIAAGYFSSGKQVTETDLVKTVGRTWEETGH